MFGKEDGEQGAALGVSQGETGDHGLSGFSAEGLV
jgi:hypothetical protein